MSKYSGAKFAPEFRRNRNAKPISFFGSTIWKIEQNRAKFQIVLSRSNCFETKIRLSKSPGSNTFDRGAGLGQMFW